MKKGTGPLDYYLVSKVATGHKVAGGVATDNQCCKSYSDALYIAHPSQENERANVDCLFSTTL